MDYGLAQGIYSNKLEGNANGLYDNIRTGLHNGLHENINIAIPKEGLVVYLDASNSGSYLPPYNGSTWFDISGRSNNGTINNAVFNTLNNGNFLFDGNNDFININNNTVINTASITYSIWVLNNTFKSLTGLSVRNINVGVNGFDLYLSNDIIFNIIRTNISSNFFYYGKQKLLQNIWYNITANYTNGIGKIFINGKLDNYTLAQTGNLQYPFAEPLRLGMDSNTARSLDGKIAFFLQYNRAISDIEVVNIFKATKSRFGY